MEHAGYRTREHPGHIGTDSFQATSNYPPEVSLVDAPLRLSLQILDHAPTVAPSTAALTFQVWKGGATDLSTRTMIADPPRWLVLSDREADQSPPETNGSLLAWDLEQILPGRRLSPTTAGGVILVSMDVDPDRDEEFNAWYNTEHIPHLSTVPGVIAARRFHAERGAPAYVALYHVENTDIYAARTWVTANETPWMLRMRRFQRNRTYFMFRTRVG
jgi:hypothetical protein